MGNFVFYILKCAKRDRILISILFCIVIAFILTIFIGSTAAYEQKQMGIVYFAGVARLILVYGFAVFNAFFITRMFQTKEIETFLAGPVDRRSFVFGIIFGNIMLIIGLSLFVTTLLKGFFYDIISWVHIIIWMGNIIAEVTLITVIACFFSLTLNNATLSIIFSTIFYITSRLMGFLISAIELQFNGSSFIGIIETLIIPLSVFFPRLDLFSQSTWLIYGDAIPNLWLIIAQSAIYIPLIITACIIDFNKKSL